MSRNDKFSDVYRKGKTLVIKAESKEGNETGAKTKSDPAEEEVRTKLDQEADRAKDDRLRIPRGLQSLAKSPEMVPWLLNIVEYERHSILRRYNLPCTFRCCGGFSSRLSRGPSRWNTRLTATGRPSDAAALRVLPAAESMRLAKRVEESLKEASRLYCRLMLRICALGQRRPGSGGRHQAWQKCMEDGLTNQNLYFLICRVVVGCLRDYHPPRSIFTAARIDQLVAADLGRLFRSTSFNLHGRTVKARRLRDSNEGMDSASEDSEEDQEALENHARGKYLQTKSRKGERGSAKVPELRITSPATQELIKATRKRVKASRRQRRSSVEGLFGDKRVSRQVLPEQGIDGSKFIDFNNLVSLQDRRSPLLSILLPSPREVALKVPDLNSARANYDDQHLMESSVQSARATAKSTPSTARTVGTPRLHSMRIKSRKVVAVELCRRGWRKPLSEIEPPRLHWVNPS